MLRTQKILKAIFVMLGCIAVISFQSCTKEVQEVAGCNFPEKENMSLILDENFEGSFIDTNRWNIVTGACEDTLVTIVPNPIDTLPPDTIRRCFWGPDVDGFREQQLFTNREENVRLDTGNLIIQARFELPQFEGFIYTSGRLSTKGIQNFSSGRIDVRAIVTSGAGLYPAVFLSPVEGEPIPLFEFSELGVFRAQGANPSESVSYFTYADTMDNIIYQEEVFSYSEEDSVDFSQDYHLYTLEWTNDCVKYSVDGREVATPITRSSFLPASWVFDREMYLVLDFAVGGSGNGNIPSGVISPFPPFKEFIIDYVKVYQ